MTNPVHVKNDRELRRLQRNVEAARGPTKQGTRIDRLLETMFYHVWGAARGKSSLHELRNDKAVKTALRNFKGRFRSELER